MNLSLPSRKLLPEACRDDYRPFPNVAWRNAIQRFVEIPLLVRLLGLPAGRRVLEVGCGRGIALRALAKLCRPSYLVGLDIDDVLLAQAEKDLSRRHIQVELVQADARAVPFPDEPVDLVIDFGTCYHISYPERALREIARVLRVDGMFVCETPESQLMAHPMRRSFRHRLLWGETGAATGGATPSLILHRNSVLWSSWVKKETVLEENL